jgi:hypothetical protein
MLPQFRFVLANLIGMASAHRGPHRPTLREVPTWRLGIPITVHPAATRTVGPELGLGSREDFGTPLTAFACVAVGHSISPGRC